MIIDSYRQNDVIDPKFTKYCCLCKKNNVVLFEFEDSESYSYEHLCKSCITEVLFALSKRESELLRLKLDGKAVDGLPE